MIKVDVIRNNVTYVGMTGKDVEDIKRKLREEKGLSYYGVSQCKFIFREEYESKEE